MAVFREKEFVPSGSRKALVPGVQIVLSPILKIKRGPARGRKARTRKRKVVLAIPHMIVGLLVRGVDTLHSILPEKTTKVKARAEARVRIERSRPHHHHPPNAGDQARLLSESPSAENLKRVNANIQRRPANMVILHFVNISRQRKVAHVRRKTVGTAITRKAERLRLLPLLVRRKRKVRRNLNLLPSRRVRREVTNPRRSREARDEQRLDAAQLKAVLLLAAMFSHLRL